MNSGRHIAGIGFILISTLLFLADYAVVVFFASTITSWSEPPGRLETSTITYSSPLLVGLSKAALVIGVVYLIAAEVAVFRQGRERDV